MKITGFLQALLVLFLSIMTFNISGEVQAKGPPDYNAEAIQKDTIKDTIANADLIVLGTITDKKYDVVTVGSGNTTGKYAYTIFTLSIEKVIKGEPSTKQVFIKVAGGYIGEIYQVPIGKYFRISDHVLVSLIKKDADVYSLFEVLPKGGQIPIDSNGGVLWIDGSVISSSTPLQEMMGRVAKIMLANNIPISLDEPVPIPADPVKRPEAVKLPEYVPQEIKGNPKSELPESYLLEQEALLAVGWNDLMTENFEGR